MEGRIGEHDPNSSAGSGSLQSCSQYFKYVFDLILPLLLRQFFELRLGLSVVRTRMKHFDVTGLDALARISLSQVFMDENGFQ